MRTIVTSYAFDRITVLFEARIVHRVAFDGTYQPSRPKTNMQTTTLKSSEVAPNARVVRILRSPTKIRPHGRRVVPSAAVHKPPGKWTVVAAFVLAIMLHAGAVMWVEIQQEKPPSEANAPLIHSMEDFETDTGTGTASAAGARIAAD